MSIQTNCVDQTLTALKLSPQAAQFLQLLRSMLASEVQAVSALLKLAH